MALLNNVAFVHETQLSLYDQLGPCWDALWGIHICKPKTVKIQEMALLLVRNLAAAPENKVKLVSKLTSSGAWKVIVEL